MLVVDEESLVERSSISSASTCRDSWSNNFDQFQVNGLQFRKMSHPKRSIGIKKLTSECVYARAGASMAAYDDKAHLNYSDPKIHDVLIQMNSEKSVNCYHDVTQAEELLSSQISSLNLTSGEQN